ncbi:MAG: anhydro-N-acetylmuramic acid kinase [Planctomycetaceae bacterium]|nr:anhydro-N-acetylmuramic acid kinase [Planctomycetaceae bacterium]
MDFRCKFPSSLRVAGLMSGTSADGIDVAIVDISARRRTVIAYDTVPYSATVRKAVLGLCDPARARVDDVCHYNFLIGRLFADALVRTCREHRISLGSIDLIGSHGQTIYHIPAGRKQGKDRIRSTLQIGEPSVIAELTGITTVADFRPRDIACGGQGAPLVPYSDYVLFGHAKYSRALQNIGGISNVTYLPAAGSIGQILAFDCGPGNMVIDALVSMITNGRKHFDAGGAMAYRGQVSQPLLEKFLRHPFFKRSPPKTTGREMFGVAYSKQFYEFGINMGFGANDIVATATALTAQTIADAYRRFLPKMPDQVILCGGGAKNRCLVNMLAERLPECRLMTTDDFGISSDAMEAVSFAILAWATIHGICNNVPSATGASRAAVLGKIIPGSGGKRFHGT